jgi:YD repeat-containing protein
MVAAGCFGNDNARVTKLVNSSGTAVRLYMDAADRRSAIDVAVGATEVSGVMWPTDFTDGRTRTILAEDLSGQLIYCERFTYRDLERVKWTITIEVRNGCGSPPASASPGSRP